MILYWNRAFGDASDFSSFAAGDVRIVTRFRANGASSLSTCSEERQVNSVVLAILVFLESL